LQSRQARESLVVSLEPVSCHRRGAAWRSRAPVTRTMGGDGIQGSWRVSRRTRDLAGHFGTREEEARRLSPAVRYPQILAFVGRFFCRSSGYRSAPQLH